MNRTEQWTERQVKPCGKRASKQARRQAQHRYKLPTWRTRPQGSKICMGNYLLWHLSAHTGTSAIINLDTNAQVSRPCPRFRVLLVPVLYHTVIYRYCRIYYYFFFPARYESEMRLCRELPTIRTERFGMISDILDLPSFLSHILSPVSVGRGEKAAAVLAAYPPPWPCKS